MWSQHLQAYPIIFVEIYYTIPYHTAPRRAAPYANDADFLTGNEQKIK